MISVSMRACAQCIHLPHTKCACTGSLAQMLYVMVADITSHIISLQPVMHTQVGRGKDTGEARSVKSSCRMWQSSRRILTQTNCSP